MKNSKPTAKPTTKPKAKPTAKPAPKPITVKPDAKLKAAWSKELSVFAKAVKNDAHAFDEKYEAIARIIEHEPPLYLAGGCSSFQEFVEKYVHEHETLVRQWVDVAKRATPEEEAKWSPTRLAILLGILRAKSIDGKLPDKIVWAKLRVDVPGKGGREQSVVGVNATLVQLRAARALILRKLGKKSPGTATQASHLLEALKTAGVDDPTTHYRDGWYTVRFASYDANKVAQVLYALDDKKEKAAKPVKPKRASKSTGKGKR